MAPRNTRVTPDTQVRSPARSFLQSLDNFYAPARDRRGEDSIQKGIGQLSNIVGEKAAAVKKDRNDNEYTQGVLDAMRDEAGQELKGVQTGSIFRQHSKYYVAGLHETKGKAAASRFKSEFDRAYQEWDGKHIDEDGSLFREFMNEQIGTFLGTLGDDRYMVAGALPIINEISQNYANHHTGFVNQRLEQETLNAYDDIIAGAFDGYNAGDYDMDQLVDRLAFEADDMYISEGGVANDRLVEAAIRYANIHNDPDALLALARGHDSGKLKINQTNRERIANAVDAVEADIQREMSRQNSREDAEAKAQRRQLLGSWGETLEADPYAQMPSFAEVGGDYTTYQQMQQLQKIHQEAGTTENPTISAGKRMRLEADLFEATSIAEKIRIVSEFNNTNPGALSTADAAKYTKEILEGADPGSLINDPTISKYRDGFGQTLGALQTDQYNLDTVSVLRTMGMRHFNDYMLAQSGNVDMNDPRAVRVAIKEAEEYAMEQLAFEFPDILKERAEAAPNEAQVLGVDDALQTRQETIDAQAAAEFAEAAGIEVPEGEEAAPEAEQVVEPQPGDEAAPEGDLPLEEQPEPYDDPNSDEPYTPTRNGFYGELINRFTDGEDTRPEGFVGGGGTYRDAAQVMAEDPEFESAVSALSGELGVPTGAILAVMDFETGGSFSTNVRNAAGSGATGLIQFMPKTARSLGTTTDELARMTRGQQMVYVAKYFRQFKGLIRGGNIDDVYMAVLYPKAIGKPDGYALFRSGTIAYRQNAGLDTNKDGVITKFEAAAKVRAKFYR